MAAKSGAGLSGDALIARRGKRAVPFDVDAQHREPARQAASPDEVFPIGFVRDAETAAGFRPGDTETGLPEGEIVGCHARRSWAWLCGLLLQAC